MRLGRRVALPVSARSSSCSRLRAAAARRSGRSRRQLYGGPHASTTALGRRARSRSGSGSSRRRGARRAVPAASSAGATRSGARFAIYGRRRSSASASTRRSRRLPLDDLRDHVVERNLSTSTRSSSPGPRSCSRPARRALVVGRAAAAFVALPRPRDARTDLDSFPYYEAHGLAIPPLANRELALDGTADRATSIVVSSRLSLFVLLAIGHPRRARAVAGYRRRGHCGPCRRLEPDGGDLRGLERARLRDAASPVNSPKPLDWVDQSDPRQARWSTSASRSPTRRDLADRVLEPLVRSTSGAIDGTAPGPGPTPDARSRATGRSLDARPATDYVSSTTASTLQAPVAKRESALSPLPARRSRSGSPTRQSGVFTDGWMGRRPARTTASRPRRTGRATRGRPLPRGLCGGRANPGGVARQDRDARERLRQAAAHRRRSRPRAIA